MSISTMTQIGKEGEAKQGYCQWFGVGASVGQGCRNGFGHVVRAVSDPNISMPARPQVARTHVIEWCSNLLGLPVWLLEGTK